MKRALFATAIATCAAVPLAAQRYPTAEAGVFAQYTHYDSFTRLGDAVGPGGRVGVFICGRFELSYEADINPTKSTKVGNLTQWDNRFTGLFNFPMGENWDLFAGGGWTGTRYKTDTTFNQYDSGGHAMLGFRRRLNDDWWWRGDAVMDFKDPSDQTPTGERTRTLGLRFGISRMWGTKRTTRPCSGTPAPAPRPAPAPPPVAAPAAAPPPAPAPAPAPAPPAPRPAPPAVAPAPAPAAAPAPAPARAEPMTFRGVRFAFDKSTLTRVAKDTLQRAVAYLKAHPDARVEIQGHTDAKGTEEYNQKLADRRADAVKAYLASRGIATSKMSTRSFGKSQPEADNGSDEGRALNRRVVIVEIP